ncbi:MAG: phosphatidate cytidylyltransferase [Oceanicaulis sp.]
MADMRPKGRRVPGDPVFKQRVLSAIVLGPVSLGLVVWGGHAFAIFIAAFAAAMAWEWVRMSDKPAPPRAFAAATGTAVGAALLAAQGEYGWTAFWIAGGSLACFLDRRPRGGAMEALVGVAYVSASAAALVSLRIGDHGGLGAVLFLLAVVWSADSFAYLVGSWIGGPKLLPIASPNKTWAGLIAGLSFGVSAGIAVAYWYGVDPVQAGLVAAPVALSAVIGDLFMSLAKRRFGVKDAGTLIPGHGGVLDRVDALMLATLAAGALMLAAPGFWPGAGS